MIDQVVVSPEEDARRRANFPIGASLSMNDLDGPGTEHLIDHLRIREPVTWLPAIGGWFITERDAARDILLPRAGTTVEAEQNMVRASLGPMMLTVDGAAHDRLRVPFEKPFRARDSQRSFGPFIEQQADRLIEAILDANQSAGFDANTSFAAPFAVTVAGHVIGLPLGETELIEAFYGDFAAAMVYEGDSEPLRRADSAREQLNSLLMAGLVSNRLSGAASLTNDVRDDPGNELTDDELVAQLRVVMFGAVETMQASVLSTLFLLLSHPDQLAEVRASPSLLSGAVDEAIRCIPPVAFIERWTEQPVTIKGVDIGVGEFVGISVLGTNTDPLVFPDPLTFDIHRTNARHGLSFSAGEHHCIGVHLARFQTVTAVGRLLESLPGLAIVDVQPPRGFVFRQPSSLRLSWNPAISRSP